LGPGELDEAEELTEDVPRALTYGDELLRLVISLSSEDAMRTVNRVRKELSSDRSHEHIEGVGTVEGAHYTRAELAASIDSGEAWYAVGAGQAARIKKVSYCPRPACMARPYITTAPDHTAANNLENLARC